MSFSDFTVLGKLGQGSFGSVYKVRRVADGLVYVLKRIALDAMGATERTLAVQECWLMASLSMGADGLLSGAGSVVAAQQVALFNAIKADDLKVAQSINDQLYPMQQAFYAEPFLDMHNRMKECLVMQGLLDRAVVRPPLMKLRDTELASLRHALETAGLLKDRIAAE
jgi:dihydrodipicolinate synthase/N-acetylneuraminate lyase